MNNTTIESDTFTLNLIHLTYEHPHIPKGL